MKSTNSIILNILTTLQVMLTCLLVAILYLYFTQIFTQLSINKDEINRSLEDKLSRALSTSLIELKEDVTGKNYDLFEIDLIIRSAILQSINTDILEISYFNFYSYINTKNGKTNDTDIYELPDYFWLNDKKDMYKMLDGGVDDISYGIYPLRFYDTWSNKKPNRLITENSPVFLSMIGNIEKRSMWRYIIANDKINIRKKVDISNRAYEVALQIPFSIFSETKSFLKRGIFEVYITNEGVSKKINELLWFNSSVGIIDNEKISYLKLVSTTLPFDFFIETLKDNKIHYFDIDDKEYFIFIYPHEKYFQKFFIWGLRSDLLGHHELLVQKNTQLYLLVSMIISLIILFILQRLIYFRISNSLKKTMNNLQLSTREQFFPSSKEIIKLCNMTYNQTKEMISHVPRSLPHHLIKNKTVFSSQNQIIGYLVIDLKGFSIYSENRSNYSLTKTINKFYSICVRIIHENQGVIDKFIGDSIVAIWHHNDAEKIALNACLSAISINQEIKQSGIFQNTNLSIRTGIDVDDNYLSIFGSQYRATYTAIGPSISVATVLEELNNLYCTDILITENTFLLAPHNRHDLHYQFIDQLIINEAPYKIYQLLQKTNIEHSHLNNEVYQSAFKNAFKNYQEGAWSKAILAFKKLQNDFPEDRLSAVFIERIRHNECPKNWDGYWQI